LPGFFTDDDTLGIFEKHAHEGTQPRGSCADDEDSILRGDLADPSGPEACSQHVAHKQCLLIRNGIWNPVQPLIRIGHPDIFCLPAVNAAAQGPTAIGVGAVVHKAPLILIFNKKL